MKTLLDTHVFFWWVTNNPRLSRAAIRTIENRADQVFVSAVVAWELGTKAQIGKWQGGKTIVVEIERIVDANGFLPMPISLSHARVAGSFAIHHRDPFDRMLAAQAETEGLCLITADRVFRDFGVETLW